MHRMTCVVYPCDSWKNFFWRSKDGTKVKHCIFWAIFPQKVRFSPETAVKTHPKKVGIPSFERQKKLFRSRMGMPHTSFDASRPQLSNAHQYAMFAFKTQNYRDKKSSIAYFKRFSPKKCLSHQKQLWKRTQKKWASHLSSARNFFQESHGYAIHVIRCV